MTPQQPPEDCRHCPNVKVKKVESSFEIVHINGIVVATSNS